VLIADDDAVNLRLLEATLARWGYDVVPTRDGGAALAALTRDDAPQLAVLDWMMPVMDGVRVCAEARQVRGMAPLYIVLLTTKDRTEDVVKGLSAGADDFLTKPFDRAELRARLEVGCRVLDLQNALAARVAELQRAVAHVQQLQGVLPICSYCKKVRRDESYWQRVEEYFEQHTEVDFSHGVCPDCWEDVLGPQMDKMWGERIPYEG
jgi:DNA-binding response OmpR family regulator